MAATWRAACASRSRSSRRCARPGRASAPSASGSRRPTGSPGGWDLDDSVAYAEALKARGCDFIDVSSGGMSPAQEIDAGPGYQVGFASEVKRRSGLPTIAVGLITNARQAETIVRSGQADLVALGRTMLFDPHWPWHAAEELRAQAAYPAQYQRSHPSLLGVPVPGNPPPPRS